MKGDKVLVYLKVITAIIIDDEPHCISALKYDLDFFCKDVSVLATCNSGEEGISAIKEHAPDLVFLDIEMPGMNGLQMLEQLGDSVNFQLIFTTAYDKFAARAFRLSAVDYLLKPIDNGDLQEAIAKVKLQLNQEMAKRLNNLKHNLYQPISEQRIALPRRDGYDVIKVSDVAYCRADGAYTSITLCDGKEILLSKSLGEVVDMLPIELFERIHHSTVVNISLIKQFIKRDGNHVVMNDGLELAVSKSKREQVMWRLGLVTKLDKKFYPC
ncbi:MAG: response regulator transcription factor [Pedobacter sp.]|nr:MAG: response regulator transcription factor [Pedobacter sp.]